MCRAHLQKGLSILLHDARSFVYHQMSSNEDQKEDDSHICQFMKAPEAVSEVTEAQAAYEACSPEEQLAIWEAYYHSQNPAAEPATSKSTCRRTLLFSENHLNYSIHAELAFSYLFLMAVGM